MSTSTVCVSVNCFMEAASGALCTTRLGCTAATAVHTERPTINRDRYSGKPTSKAWRSVCLVKTAITRQIRFSRAIFLLRPKPSTSIAMKCWSSCTSLQRKRPRLSGSCEQNCLQASQQQRQSRFSRYCRREQTLSKPGWRPISASQPCRVGKHY